MLMTLMLGDIANITGKLKTGTRVQSGAKKA